MRLLLILVLLAACASPTPETEPSAGDTVEVTGTVTSVDLGPMAYDGDALIELATDAGTVTVRIPARMNLCEASGLGALDQIRVGDRVDATGALGADGSVTPCTGADHELRYVGQVDRSERQ